MQRKLPAHEQLVIKSRFVVFNLPCGEEFLRIDTTFQNATAPRMQSE